MAPVKGGPTSARTYLAAPSAVLGRGPGVGVRGPGLGRGPLATPRFQPGRPFPAPTPRVCLEKKAGQFVFIQSHLRSHFGEMKREKRASRARPAGCPLVPGGALVGGRPPLPFPPRPLPAGPSPDPAGSGSEGGGPQAGQRPGHAHLHEAHTRGPSAKAQLNAGGGGRPKLAFPRPSGARSGCGRTKGAGRGERRVCRGIDLQMRLCQRIKAGRTPDPRPPPPPARPAAPCGPGPGLALGGLGPAWLSQGVCRRPAGELLSPLPGPGSVAAVSSRAPGPGPPAPAPGVAPLGL